MNRVPALVFALAAVLWGGCDRADDDPPPQSAGIHHQDPALREQAVLELEKAEILRRRETLRQLVLTDPAPAVRRAAAAALAYVARDRDSIPTLVQALATEEHPAVLRRLLGGLARFSNDDRAIEALVSYWLDEPPDAVEADVKGALAGLGSDRVRPVLARLAPRDPERAAVLESILEGTGP